MKKIMHLFVDSYVEFKQLRTITTCAMFGALAVILGYFTIQIGDFIKIGFSNIPNEAVGYLFGPVASPFFGAAMDLIKYLIKPTGAFFPGFTLTAAAAGLLYGMLLYQRPLKFGRILGTKLLVILICDVCMNTLWLSILYGQGFLVLLPMRLLKNLIMWPLEAMILYLVIKTLETTGVFKILHRQGKINPID